MAFVGFTSQNLDETWQLHWLIQFTKQSFSRLIHYMVHFLDSSEICMSIDVWIHNTQVWNLVNWWLFGTTSAYRCKMNQPITRFTYFPLSWASVSGRMYSFADVRYAIVVTLTSCSQLAFCTRLVLLFGLISRFYIESVYSRWETIDHWFVLDS